jgi:hypothetical protein
MFAQRVGPDELIGLLAAESYDPVLMDYCGYTKNSPKLGDFIAEKARLGVTGTTQTRMFRRARLRRFRI